MLLKYFSLPDNGDIHPLIVGHYKCPSSNSFGPHVRDYYIVHFVLNGKGVLINERGTHPVSKGELFVIREGEMTTYVADKEEPWEYVWIGFSGKRRTLFDGAPDVIKTPADIDMKLYEYVKREESAPDIFASILYELFYHLFADNSEKESIDEKIRNVHRYIKYNYMNKITVAGLAAEFGFDRSYLYRMFKEKYGMGPKEYLTKTRLEKARWLLARNYSVAECAYMVGYSDPFAFSKAYKAYYGVSPSLDELA